jgi:hypothetical protein
MFRICAKVTESSARRTALAPYPGEVDDVEYELESDGTRSTSSPSSRAPGGPGVRVEVDAVTGRSTEVRKEGYEGTTQ